MGKLLARLGLVVVLVFSYACTTAQAAPGMTEPPNFGGLPPGSGTRPVALSTRVCRGWQTGEGLPEQTVKSIIQSRDGYIWMATQDGLGRCDGVNFTTFSTVNTRGLATDDFDQLLEDGDGFMWLVGVDGISTMQGNVFKDVTPLDAHGRRAPVDCRLDPKKRFWVQYRGILYHGEHGRLISVYSFPATGQPPTWAVDASGAVWSTNKSGDLDRIDSHGTVTIPLATKPTPVVHTIAADGQNQIWLTSTDGLDRIDAGAWPRSGAKRADHYPLREGVRNIAPQATIGSDAIVITDGQGDVWCLASHRLFRMVDNRLTPIAEWQGIPIHRISLNANGDLLCWFRPMGDGFANVGICVNRSFVYASLSEGLMGKPLSCLRDTQGDIWLGTDSGVNCFRDRLCKTFGPHSGLGISRITSTLIDLGSRVWVAQSDGTLYRYLGDSQGRFALILRSPHAIESMAETSYGTYLCIVDGAIKQIDGTVLRDYHVAGLDSAPLGRVTSLAIGKTGDLWITGANGIANIDHGKLQRYELPDGGAGAHSPSGRLTTFEDVERRLWVATETGLYCIANGSVRAYHVNDGVPDLPIDAIFEDRMGSVWFGHRGAGLTRYAKGRFRTITRRDGLPSDSVAQILQDNNDNLWFGSPKEIYRVKVKELNAFVDSGTPFHAYTYGPPDGNFGGNSLSGTQMSSLPSIGAWDSCVWISCKFGIVRITASSSSHPCPVVFDGATFDGVERSTVSPPTIPPGDGNAVFRFAALDLNDPEHMQFSYRLGGFDRDWIDAGRIRQAIYTNLPPGTYRFEVKCVNVDADWSATRSLEFTLLPHFYQTWWFKLLSLLVTAAVIISYARARMQSLQRRNQVLQGLHETLEAQNDMLKESHAELEAQNDALSDLQSELEAQNSELITHKATLEVVNAKLHSLATTDGLTGLTNHRTFQEDLLREWNQSLASGEPLSILLIDVDHFKLFNDQYGHQAGDQVLIAVGKSLRSTARESDSVARYGGEEFAVILRKTDAAASEIVAERFRQAIAENSWDDRVITASVGVSTYTPLMSSTDALIEAADIALYRSKEHGRNRVTHAGHLNAPSINGDAAPYAA